MSERPTVTSIADAVTAGRRSASDVVGATLERMAAVDPGLACFRELYPEPALRRAEILDRRIAAGEPVGPLAGVPIAVKDNIATDFGHTSCGSRMLEEYRSPFTATAVERLIADGAIVVGKTSCDEFAMGSSTEHCAFGAARNPWDPSRVPGGSSGGSAAAVASGACPVTLGSDTGGSIRQPAALCGVVGIKPSYGRVSRYGLVAFGSSLDQIGPFAANVEDAALILESIAGVDDRDATSADLDVPSYRALLDEPIPDLRVGVARQYLSRSNDPAVAAATEAAIDVFRGLGATIVDVDLPLTDYGIATYYVLATAEASSNLARYDGIRYGHRAEVREGESLFDLYAKSRAEGFGPEVRRRIMLGTYVLSAGYYDAYYVRALKARRLIREDYDRAFADCHVIIGPTSPVPAFPIGEKQDPLEMYLLDVYTTNASIAGICGMSVPAGFAERDHVRLPIGLQIQAPAFDELTMLRVARMFEAQTAFHRAVPPALSIA